MPPTMLEGHEAFAVYLELLSRVVRVRGGDSNALSVEYAWPGDVAVPRAAVSLSPLLTGGQNDPGSVSGAMPSGVVPMPFGIEPPKS